MRNRLLAFGVSAAWLVFAAPLLALTTTTPSAHAASIDETSTAGLDYVALGDSYAAGYGLSPLTDLPATGCGQSVHDYPHQVAAQLGLDLTDATCSGAVAADISGTAQVTGDGTAPPQDTALSSATRIVSLTIGGNDLGFSSIAAYCVALSANGPPLLHPSQHDCRSHYTEAGADNLRQRITSVVAPAVAADLAAIHAKAPHAKVFVIGYPALAPDAANTPAGGCFRSSLGYPPPTDGYPFTSADLPFLLQTEQALDASIQADTTAAGYTYISTMQASLTHTPCAASASWINGLSLESLLPPTVRPGALHPNAAGVAYDATQLSSAIEAAFPMRTPEAGGTTSHRLLALAVLALAAGMIAAVPGLLHSTRSRREQRGP